MNECIYRDRGRGSDIYVEMCIFATRQMHVFNLVRSFCIQVRGVWRKRGHAPPAALMSRAPDRYRYRCIHTYIYTYMYMYI